MELLRTFTCPFPSLNFTDKTAAFTCLNHLSLLTQHNLFKGNLSHWNQDLTTACDLKQRTMYPITELCRENITQAIQDLCLNHKLKIAREIGHACAQRTSMNSNTILMGGALITIVVLIISSVTAILCTKKCEDEERQRILAAKLQFEIL